MKVVVIGLGVQGNKRAVVAGKEVVATVDPVARKARYRSIQKVRPDSFDTAFVCTPDSAKLKLIRYLLAHGKNVLAEKPLLARESRQLAGLRHFAKASGRVCYTAYNHRFEPNLIRLKQFLDRKAIGRVYYANFFYGNGTARDVRNSSWRDRGAGVLPDLGSHLLDMVLFLFGKGNSSFEMLHVKNYENRTPDHVLFASKQTPRLRLEATLLSWKNTFTIDVVGERGSLHMNGLCKWGKSTLTFRRRTLPSGRPKETVFTVPAGDPTWKREHAYFKRLCRQGGTNLENDIWINGILQHLASPAGRKAGAR